MFGRELATRAILATPVTETRFFLPKDASTGIHLSVTDIHLSRVVCLLFFNFSTLSTPSALPFHLFIRR